MLRPLRQTIKHAYAAALYYSGLLHVYRKLRFGNRAWILMYHRVLPPADARRTGSSDAIVVTPQTFERHLRWLRRHFTILGMQEFAEHIASRRPFERPVCLVTFDDGWKDNATNALPLLQKCRIPAAVFLATDYIGSDRCFWQERLTHLLMRLRSRPALRQHPLVARHRLDVVFDMREDRALAWARLRARHFKTSPPAEIDALERELAALLARDGAEASAADVDRFMTWDDVRRMAQSGIELGSHTASHRILTQLDETEIERELKRAKAAIEQRLGTAITAFAYPNGDHNPDCVRLARTAGYRLAFTTERGTVAPGDDPHRLRRINIHERATRSAPLLFATLMGIV